ncbi:uncharacterized protein N7482_010506 [Penicillium canariense]|uniref:Uncharacterized protein n=1 Tax=Penicillium canariense TaxID=189055 RepID=A0A9W9LE48_9EURO|nr:uncharacterized protein N7482_010506 [Penicillium canariense]KAJ5151254.1 hypothetical protein N7482_010506 [Penicillium canariense]
MRISTRTPITRFVARFGFYQKRGKLVRKMREEAANLHDGTKLCREALQGLPRLDRAILELHRTPLPTRARRMSCAELHISKIAQVLEGVFMILVRDRPNLAVDALVVISRHVGRLRLLDIDDAYATGQEREIRTFERRNAEAWSLLNPDERTLAAMSTYLSRCLDRRCGQPFCHGRRGRG